MAASSIPGFIRGDIQAIRGRIVKVEEKRTDPHWDSGFDPELYYCCEVWDAEDRVVRVTGVYRPEGGWTLETTPTVDIAADLAPEVANFMSTLTWLQYCTREVESRARAAETMEKGDVVEVFKGRKIPKGEYILVDKYQGDWGPCVTLAEPHPRGGLVWGKRHSWISADNIRPTKVANFKDIPYLAMFKQLSTLGGEELGITLAVFADLLDDHDDERAETVRHIGAALQKHEAGFYTL